MRNDIDFFYDEYYFILIESQQTSSVKAMNTIQKIGGRT